MKYFYLLLHVFVSIQIKLFPTSLKVVCLWFIVSDVDCNYLMIVVLLSCCIRGRDFCFLNCYYLHSCF